MAKRREVYIVKAKKMIGIQPRIIPELVSPELLNTNCIAEDPYYGTYRAQILGGFQGTDEVRVAVKILKCIKQPSNRAIINKDAFIHRKNILFPVYRSLTLIRSSHHYLEETA